MVLQIPVEAEARVGREAAGGLTELSPDLACLRLAIVNVVLIGPAGAGDRAWVLVDAGIPGARDKIVTAAAARFGPEARPAAIILTHGHFDHVGALEALAEAWDVPVFAHPREHGFLDGTQSYPPADTSAGGGLMTRLAPLFPRRPVDVGARLRALPEDGSLPFLPGWTWIPTPGHTPGQVALWQPATRTLLAGDAVITTGQESAYEVAAQTPELHGPPRYFTPDWAEAETSVQRLNALGPELLVSGHGPALAGPQMRRALDELTRNFRAIAVP